MSRNKDYKIRCSSLSYFMGRMGLTELQEHELNTFLARLEEGVKPLTERQAQKVEELIYKRDNIELPETVKSILFKDWLYINFGIRDDIQSSPTLKGTSMEQESINLLSLKDMELYTKNKERFNNDTLSGEPDIIKGNEVIDIKTSFDITTYFKTKYEYQIKGADNTNYFWQLQGYLNLVGAEKARLCYCLMDTPSYLVAKEMKKHMYNNGTITDEVMDQIESRHSFGHIPLEKRIFEISFNKCPDAQDMINKELPERHKLAIRFLDTLDELLL